MGSDSLQRNWTKKCIHIYQKQLKLLVEDILSNSFIIMTYLKNQLEQGYIYRFLGSTLDLLNQDSKEGSLGTCTR
jgi:hypothetical protein